MSSNGNVQFNKLKIKNYDSFNINLFLEKANIPTFQKLFSGSDKYKQYLSSDRRLFLNLFNSVKKD